MSSAHPLKLWTGLGLLVIGIAIQQFAQSPIQNEFTNSLTNGMHIPLFTVFTLAIMWIRPNWPLLRVFLVVAAIGILTELLQTLTARQASYADMVRNLVGMGIALTLFRSQSLRRAVLAVVIATVLGTLAAWPVLIGYQYQINSFPTLYEPNDWRAQILLKSNSPTRLTTQHTWTRYADESVLAVTWRKQNWPGVHLREPIAHWHTYDTLVLDVYNLEAEPQPLTVGVRHVGKQGTARYLTQSLKPGDNQLKFAVADLAFSAPGDSASISHVMFYTTAEHAGKQVLFGRANLQ